MKILLLILVTCMALVAQAQTTATEAQYHIDVLKASFGNKAWKDLTPTQQKVLDSSIETWARLSLAEQLRDQANQRQQREAIQYQMEATRRQQAHEADMALKRAQTEALQYRPVPMLLPMPMPVLLPVPVLQTAPVGSRDLTIRLIQGCGLMGIEGINC